MKKKYEQHGIIGHFDGNPMEYLYTGHSMCARKVQMLIDSNLGVRAVIRTMVYLYFHLCFTNELNVLETIFLCFSLLVNRGLIVS